VDSDTQSAQLAQAGQLAELRRNYQSVPFDIADTAADPFEQFGRWFDEIAATGLLEPNAAVLATASADGRPSARHVLVKGVSDGGFVLYTNHGSRKAADLEANPRAALVFAWAPLSRQVIVEGAVSRVSEAASDAYFASRPRESQLGAWASPQSAELASRVELDDRYRAVAARYADREIPRPPQWGGSGGWSRTRLAP
jgi:pyridoxamine 5'-phosphate oxidase